MKKGTLEKQIRRVLMEDEASRNSDIRLTQVVWFKFYQDKLRYVNEEWTVSLKNLFDLPRGDNIKRIRAKIQNDQKEYLPTDKAIAKKRGWQEDSWRSYLGYGVAGIDNQTL